MANPAILLVDNLTIKRNNKPLVENFSHSFLPGEIVALLGNNGSGKTTLLKTLAGLIPSKGQIFVDEKDLFLLTHKQRATSISFLSQTTPDHPYCKAMHRIAHGLMPTIGFDIFFDKKIENSIKEVAERLSITHLLDAVLSHLSGGEQRLVHIAKCLIQKNTKLLLLDEPSVFLDFSQQANLLRCLKEEAKMGRVVIFSSHDSGFIKECAHRVLFINHQRVEMF